MHHAVAMTVMARHRRGDALPNERDDELADRSIVARVVTHDDFGDADRSCGARLGRGRIGRAEGDPRRRAESEPVVGRMVERERDFGDVHVRPSEGPADDGVARFRDRCPALHDRREAEPEQPVVAVVVMDVVARSTRSMPVHSRISWWRRDASNGPSNRMRWPIGETSTVISASKPIADVKRPSGVRCQGPSANSGWFGYSR